MPTKDTSLREKLGEILLNVQYTQSRKEGIDQIMTLLQDTSWLPERKKIQKGKYTTDELRYSYGYNQALSQVRSNWEKFIGKEER